MFNILYLSAADVRHYTDKVHLALDSHRTVSAAQHKWEICNLWECKQTIFTHVCESILYTHTYSALKAVSLVRPCLSILSVNKYLLTKKPSVLPTTTCTSSEPGPSPAKGKENQWFLYLSTDRADNSMWITVHRRWLTDWDIDLKKSLQNSLQHDLSSHQAKGGRGEEGTWNERRRHVLISVSLARCQLHSHARWSPFLIHSCAAHSNNHDRQGKSQVTLCDLSPVKARSVLTAANAELLVLFTS